DLEGLAPGAIGDLKSVDQQVHAIRRHLVSLGNVGAAPSPDELSERKRHIELLQQELPALLRKAERLKELPSVGPLLADASGPSAVADFIELAAATPTEVLRFRIAFSDDSTAPTLKDACVV